MVRDSDSDSELLERWREGDRQAGTVLFERYYQAVERFFVNKVSDASTEIRDLVQETFLALVKQRDRVSNFRSYLFSVAYKRCQDHLRRKYRKDKRGVHIELDDISQISVHDLFPSPSAVVHQHEQQRLLLEGLRRLPLEQQTLLELYYWEDLRLQQIAEIIGIVPGTVKSRLSSARKKLAKILTSIARSQEVLESTLSDLEEWARKCRALQARGAGPDEGS